MHSLASAVLNLAESERVSMCTALIRRFGTLPNQSVFEPDESQPCRITLHVSDAKVASAGALYLRLPNQPNQKSLHACRIRNCDATLGYAKVEYTFVTAMRRKLHLQDFSAEGFGPMCCRDESFPNLHSAPLFRDSRWLRLRSSDSAVLNLAES